jgi:DMSO/TMAO reductase YedYZ molybdopterin-dependent catalytic subunit
MRKRRLVGTGALVGGLTGLAIVGLTYLGGRLAQLPFIAFDLFDWLARVLPGAIINLTIDGMVRIITLLKIGPTWVVAKLAEQIMGMGLLVLAGVALGSVLGIVGGRRPERLPWFGAAGGLLLLVPALAAELSVGFPAAGPALSVLWLAVVFVGWGLALGKILQASVPREEEEGTSRRRFLWLVGLGSFAVVVGALGVRVLGGKGRGKVSGAPESVDGGILESDLTSGPAASPPWRTLETRIEPAPGTRPELTRTKDFYRIDINTRPPEIDGDSWRLDVKGLVDRPLRLSIEDLRSRPAVSQAITLSCISNPVGGDLISAAVWTGLRLKDLLAEAGLRSEARAVNISATDGFYESVGLAEAMDDRTLLVYAMNGEPLPVSHGFPLRIFIPGHYGMKQPKWILSLEAVGAEGPGYWVDRGWDKTAEPKTTSVIDSAAHEVPDARTGLLPVGGIAYAGERGISRVEVQVDDGPWAEASLRVPPLGPLTWIQWCLDWKSSPGRHTFRVRAYDGRGVLQDSRQKGSFPDGATGLDAKSAEVRKARS